MKAKCIVADDARLAKGSEYDVLSQVGYYLEIVDETGTKALHLRNKFVFVTGKVPAARACTDDVPTLSAIVAAKAVRTDKDIEMDFFRPRVEDGQCRHCQVPKGTCGYHE